MMSKHKLLAQIALLEAELAKKDKLLREKDKNLAEQEEQANNFEQENELLQADQNGSVREKKQESEINSVFICKQRPNASEGDQGQLKTSEGDQSPICPTYLPPQTVLCRTYIDHGWA
eukprot:14814583-Ditylum_brightwellii.AAC.1